MKKEIGERIRNARKDRRINQFELCADLGISQPTLMKVENGNGNVGIDIYERILKYLDLEL